MATQSDAVRRFTDAVKSGDRDAVLDAIDQMTARAEANEDDSEMREFLHVAATVPFGRK